jgi:serine/threonine protein kinase
VTTARQVGGFHTASVVGADPDADPPWMATAHIAGPSLAEAIARRGALEEAEVRRLGAGLAEGVAAIHECGLIHRDLKVTGSNAVIGTLRYMSPEQLNGHELTPQGDVFALGTILAFAATADGNGHSYLWHITYG